MRTLSDSYSVESENCIASGWLVPWQYFYKITLSKVIFRDNIEKLNLMIPFIVSTLNASENNTDP